MFVIQAIAPIIINSSESPTLPYRFQLIFEYKENISRHIIQNKLL